MKPSANTIRTRRSDYVIRKQADYGSRRWSVHYRTRHHSDPYILAYTDTRQQARDLVALMMETDESRWQALRAQYGTGRTA